MKAIFKEEILILIPDVAQEAQDLGHWKAQYRGHHFQLTQDDGSGLMLRSLGDPRLNEPINVTSQHPSHSVQLIGNFAATPFVLDGRQYASVESFWQSLKYQTEEDRESIACLPGLEAKQAARKFPNDTSFEYGGKQILVGSFDHWELMARACAAKFEQNPQARRALVMTFPHPLQHRPRGDSRTIPGEVMARIWTGLRHQYRASGDSSSIE
jgi:predicted NAD-dependent protein-ADP-ribosyltransferase YbiA (DUF1768 family)